MPKPNIIILDTETTGLDSAEDRLVELAAISYDDPSKQFTTFVNPGRDIPPESRSVHHISPSDVANAPSESEALGELLRFFAAEDPDSPWVFVAHNAKFDRGFIERIQPALAGFWACTLKNGYLLYPEAPSYGNQVLRYYLGLEIETPPDLFPHRALYDVIVTREILADQLKRKSLRDHVSDSNNLILLPKITFGKHKGTAFDKVPFGYLKWITGQDDMDDDVKHTAAYWMRNSR